MFLRPWFWIPTLASAFTGYFLSHPRADPVEILLVVTAAGALSAASEGINDISDYDIDQGTPGSMVGALRLSRGSGAIGHGLSMAMAWSAIATCIFGGLLAAAALSAPSFVAGACALLLSAVYSLPPLRMKRWGAAGITIHAVGYGPVAMALGAGAAIGRPEIATWAVLVGLWIAIVGLTADVLDIDIDRKAGIRTVPVLLGRRNTILSIAAGSLLMVGTVTAHLIWAGLMRTTFLALFWLIYLAWLVTLLRFTQRSLRPEMHIGSLLLEAIFPLMVLL